MEPPSGTSQPGLSVGEASRLLGVSRNTVRRWCAVGRLRSERVGRPQGEAIRVFLDAIHADDALDQDIPGNIPGDVPPEVPSTPRQDVTDVPGRAQAMALYNRELIEPLVAALERSQATIREQAETIGELRATIARLAAPGSPLTASTGPPASETAPGPLPGSWRPWAYGTVAVLALVAAVVLLVWPW